MFALNQYVILMLAFFVPQEFKSLKKRDVIFPFGCKKFYIEIFVSPVMTKYGKHPLKVMWDHALFEEGDWIGIFKTDPETNQVMPEPEQIIPVKKKYGSTLTLVLQEPVSPEKLGFKGKCLGYFAAYFDKCHNIFAATCLRIEPDWMWRLRNKIGRKKIKNTLIPGSFQTPWILKSIENLPLTERYFYKDEGILGQLLYGSRYIFLKIKYDTTVKIRWWAEYYVNKTKPLYEVFREIRRFIENTNEIVILDFKEFLGFDSKIIHVKFISYLDKQIGDLAVRNKLNWNSTFNQVWYTRKRLILAYNQENAKEGSFFLWNTIEHKLYSGDTQEGLFDYFHEIYNRPPQTAWSAIINYAPEELDKQYLKSLDPTTLLDFLNTELSRRYKQYVWLDGSNIVTVNYLKGTGIVRSAIQWNSGQCR